MVAIAAREAGEGEPVVLLHGLFGSGGNLGALARALRDHYRVFSVDLPGHGASGVPASFDLPGMASSVAAWVDDDVFAGLFAVAAAGCTRREDAQALLEEHVAEPGVVQFLLSDLRRDEGGQLRWRLALNALHAAYPALARAPAAGRSYPGPVLFIKGGDSRYLSESQRPVIEALFPAAKVRVVPGTGHWLHVVLLFLF